MNVVVTERESEDPRCNLQGLYSPLNLLGFHTRTEARHLAPFAISVRGALAMESEHVPHRS